MHALYSVRCVCQVPELGSIKGQGRGQSGVTCERLTALDWAAAGRGHLVSREVVWREVGHTFAENMEWISVCSLSVLSHDPLQLVCWWGSLRQVVLSPSHPCVCPWPLSGVLHQTCGSCWVLVVNLAKPVRSLCQSLLSPFGPCVGPC